MEGIHLFNLSSLVKPSTRIPGTEAARSKTIVAAIRVGLCGFTMAMEDYALHSPVVEVQHTFYEPPRDEVMRGWLAATPQSLEYTMKVWQLVTHPANSPTYRRLKRALPAGAEAGSSGRRSMTFAGVAC